VFPLRGGSVPPMFQWVSSGEARDCAAFRGRGNPSRNAPEMREKVPRRAAHNGRSFLRRPTCPGAGSRAPKRTRSLLRHTSFA